MNKVYVRVSTDKQIGERQDYILDQKGYNKENSLFYEETFSGKTKNRPILNQLLSELQKDDVVIVTDLSRLARSVKDLWVISDDILSKGATLVSLKENIDLSTSSGRLVFSMLGSIYQFEREVLSDRTKEALKAKKANGTILGRPITLDETNLENAINVYLYSKLSMKVVASKYNISDCTLCNKLKQRNLKRNNK